MRVIKFRDTTMSMKIEINTKNKIAANFLKEILATKSDDEIFEYLDENASRDAKSGINYLAHVYMFDAGLEDSAHDLFIAVEREDENSITEIRFFDAENIFKAVEKVADNYFYDDLGAESKEELILSWLTDYDMSDIAECLKWQIDEDKDDGYF